MENSIEICGSCGKMPRTIDYSDGFFECIRCGHTELSLITSDSYYMIHELDRNFHELIMRKRLDSIPRTLFTDRNIQTKKVKTTKIKISRKISGKSRSYKRR